jgi:hypothetical protein
VAVTRAAPLTNRGEVYWPATLAVVFGVLGEMFEFP